MLKLQEKVILKDGEEYLAELIKIDSMKIIKAEKLRDLTGVVSLGGDAVKEHKEIYE